MLVASFQKSLIAHAHSRLDNKPATLASRYVTALHGLEVILFSASCALVCACLAYTLEMYTRPMYYKGAYHFFYQYNPEGATFGKNMVWAHSVSKDLINWIHLNDAITPTCAGDINSCFSGSATILPEGTGVIECPDFCYTVNRLSLNVLCYSKIVVALRIWLQTVAYRLRQVRDFGNSLDVTAASNRYWGLSMYRTAHKPTAASNSKEMASRPVETAAGPRTEEHGRKVSKEDQVPPVCIEAALVWPRKAGTGQRADLNISSCHKGDTAHGRPDIDSFCLRLGIIKSSPSPFCKCNVWNSFILWKFCELHVYNFGLTKQKLASLIATVAIIIIINPYLNTGYRDN
ncbi:hypothetical protein KIW84_025435 [Lathyrus oleraceus]|uniref:Glycosyl hydrolase family 32 N-terminal domain-containing protein n=1 Tax=Pisum sativum TaxID=3888 RepID=A0A9D5BD66_PEA|nr:hypothetical protein KIW84_025435 [Pisum sativum]